MKWTELLKTFAKLTFSAILVYWLIATGKFPLDALSKLTDPKLLAIGILFVGTTLFAASERWRYLLFTQNIKLSIIPAFKLTTIGLFFSFFLPGGVGGDLVKSYYISKETPGQKSLSIGAVVFDRIIGLFAMLCIALVSIFVGFENFQDKPEVKPLAVITLGLFFFFLISFYILWSRKMLNFRKKIIHWTSAVAPMSSLIEKIFRFQISRFQFNIALAISLFAQISNLIFFTLAAKFVHPDPIPMEVFLFAVPLGFIAQAIPISPGGVGVGQAAFYFLFTMALGSDAPVGPALISFFQVFSLLYGLFGAYFYLSLKKNSPQLASPGVA